jgi:putative IMPACT (imprinted ancient) family translation regulator
MLDLEYSTDVVYVTGVLKKWLKARPDNPELQDVIKSFSNIVFYANRQSQDRWLYDKQISEARYERNQATLRARQAEKEIVKLQEQLKTSKYEL